jgi:hypothetical protein
VCHDGQGGRKAARCRRRFILARHEIQLDDAANSLEEGAAVGCRSPLGFAIAVAVVLFAAGGVALVVMGPPMRQTGKQAGRTEGDPVPPPVSGGTYQGRTASQWGADLLDKDLQVSDRAAYALYVLGEEGVPYLAAGLSSDSRDIRITSASTLNTVGTNLGSKAKAAIPALRKAAQSSDVKVRENAIAALRSIDK